MKINFAQINPEYLSCLSEANMFGPDENGDFYYNYVEFGSNAAGTDEVVIADGCARYMPISVEHIPELIIALKECYKLHTKLEKAENLQELVESDAEARVTGEYTVRYPQVSDFF